MELLILIWNIVFYVFSTTFFSSVFGYILIFSAILYLVFMVIKVMKGGY